MILKMKYIISIILLLIGFKADCFSQGASLAVKQTVSENDTLTVGNDQLSLFYTCKADVIFIGYQRNNEKAVYFKSPKPDLQLLQEHATFALRAFKQEKKSRFPGEERYTEVSLHYQVDDLEIKRIWEVYPNVPVISSYYYLKGMFAVLANKLASSMRSVPTAAELSES